MEINELPPYIQRKHGYSEHTCDQNCVCFRALLIKAQDLKNELTYICLRARLGRISIYLLFLNDTVFNNEIILPTV